MFLKRDLVHAALSLVHSVFNLNVRICNSIQRRTVMEIHLDKWQNPFTETND
jgi:hypothetical protein